MARPIPVFAFVFAAYAATSDGGRGGGRPRDESDAADPFLLAWRALSAGRARIRVKIAVRDARAVLQIAPRARGPMQEVWLGDIEQTREGFRGAVSVLPVGMRGLKRGQALDFRLDHVRDWTLGTLPESTDMPDEIAERALT